jgi:hypothetical protein
MIQKPLSDDEADYASLDDDDEPMDRVKRPRIYASSSPSLGGSQRAGPSGSRNLWGSLSPSLGEYQPEVLGHSPQNSQLQSTPNSSQSLGGPSPDTSTKLVISNLPQRHVRFTSRMPSSFKAGQVCIMGVQVSLILIIYLCRGLLWIHIRSLKFTIHLQKKIK